MSLLAAFAALLATGVTLGVLSVARIGLDAPPINGVSLDGMPFAFDTIAAQDVQFTAFGLPDYLGGQVTGRDGGEAATVLADRGPDG